MSDFTFLFSYSCKDFSSIINLFTIMLLHSTVLTSGADSIAQYETKLEDSPSKLMVGLIVPKVWSFL